MISNAYFAGLFDGEGFVRIDDHHVNPGSGNRIYQLHLGITMVHKPTVQACFERWGGFFKGDEIYRRKNPANRCCYRWAVVSNGAHRFLLAIREYSITKRDEIELAISFQEHLALHKRQMLGYCKDPELKAAKNEYRRQVFAERAIMCAEMRRLKKINYPMIESDSRR